MTLTELHGLLSSALDAYAAGGSGWAIQSGIQIAAHYEDFDNFSTDGICVYAWIGGGEAQDESDAPQTCEMETVLHARALFVGDRSLLALRAAMLTDDLQRMLLSINGSAGCTVSIHSFDAPLITANAASIAVRALCRYAGGAA